MPANAQCSVLNAVALVFPIRDWRAETVPKCCVHRVQREIAQELFCEKPIEAVLKGVYPMQTAMPSTSSSRHHAVTQLHSPEGRHVQNFGAISQPRPGRRPSLRISDVDSLLKIADSTQRTVESRAPGSHAEAAVGVMSMDGEQAGGIFLGLRTALLLNAGVGVVALLMYEAWFCMAH